MKIVAQKSLDEFDGWSGGFDTLETLRNMLEYEEWEHLEEEIEKILDPKGEGIDERDLNDFLWYETDQIAEILGYEDWDAFLNADD